MTTSATHIEKLLQIMQDLRDQQTGCSWDIAQNFGSIAPYTIEEAYEVADAIDRGNMADLKEELGDLLFQVVFHAQIAQEQKAFDFSQVVDAICEKMIRRHPNIFSAEGKPAMQPQKQDWETLKKIERDRKSESSNKKSSLLDDIPLNLPALLRSSKMTKRLAKVGFDWANAAEVREKIDEELSELDDAIKSENAEHIEEELGDVMFCLTNLARKLDLNPENVLHKANRKFEARIHAMEQILFAQGVDIQELTLQQMENLWQQVKKQRKEMIKN